MRREIKSFVRRLHKDESGSAIVLVAISIVALLGVTALAIDVANLVYAQRRLQATTDMAAQAAALDLNCTTTTPGCTTTPVKTATTFSAASGDLNAQPGLNVTTVSVNLYCLSSTGVFLPQGETTCSSSSGDNAIEVQQQATVPLIFGHLLGPLSTFTLTATSLASAKRGALPPLHIMLVIDNTGSMNTLDSGPTGTAPTNCGIANPSKLQCALAGAQLLVNQLWPTQDEVGLVVFPPVKTATAGNEANATRPPSGCETAGSNAPVQPCNGLSTTCVGNGGANNGYGLPTVQPAGCPQPMAYNAAGATYVVAVGGTTGNPMVTNYKTSNTAPTLDSTKPLPIALCQLNMATAAETCKTGNDTTTGTGMWVYDYSSTYLAGAITVAQNTLNANSQPGVQNVMIVLSDGGAGNGNGAPATNQCILSVTAAENAANARTWVYSIAYGSSTALSPNGASCSDTETPKISACTTMQKIASDPTKFYSDPLGASNSVDVNTYSLHVNTYSLEEPTDAPTSSNVLNFASGSTSTVQVGMGVQDATHTTYIPAGTTVTGTTATTVTISNNVTNTIPSGDEIQFAYSFSGSTVLYFSSVSATVQVGMGVQDVTTGHTTYIPAGTTVTAKTATTVTLSSAVPTGDTIPPGDEIQFAYSFPYPSASYTTLFFTSVPSTVVKGMGVADATNPTVILPGTTVLSTTATTVTISTASGNNPTGNGGITGIGVQPNDVIVFNPAGDCISQYNPSPNDIVNIFSTIGVSLQYTQLLPLSCLTSGAGSC